VAKRRRRDVRYASDIGTRSDQSYGQDCGRGLNRSHDRAPPPSARSGRDKRRVLSKDEELHPHSRQEPPPTFQAMGPLSRRMIEDMTIRKFAPKIQHGYLQSIK
jgi:hypothetical protein